MAIKKKEFKESISYRYVDIIKKELVKEGLVTEGQLKAAMSVQKSTQEGIGRNLLRLDFISKEKIIDFLGRHLGIPYVDLKGYVIDPGVIELVPEEMVRKYKLVPLFKIQNTLTVAMVDPLDISAIDALVHRTGLTIEPMVSTEEDIIKTINQYYSRARRPEGVLGKENEGDLVSGVEGGEQELESIAATATIVREANEIILEAVRERASDIHLEPEEKNVPVRFRVDGFLRKARILPKDLELAIISRIKIMANLDIAERRIPQDGSFTVTVENRPVDLRV
ncbi:type II secretion system protein GspE, partial [Candidatus Aerophobetes bacterium]